MPQNTTKEPLAEVIFIGIDAHVERYVTVRQIDGLPPQPAQTFRKEGTLLNWIAKQQLKACKVVCCYEAWNAPQKLIHEL